MKASAVAVIEVVKLQAVAVIEVVSTHHFCTDVSCIIFFVNTTDDIRINKTLSHVIFFVNTTNNIRINETFMILE